MPDQEFDFPIMGGADTGTDAVSSVKPRKMINCWYQKTEGIVRRFGTQRLTTSSSVYNVKDTYDRTLDPESAYYSAWLNESPVSLIVDRDDIRLRTGIYTREFSNNRWYITDVLPSVKVDQLSIGVTSDPGITTSTIAPGVGSTDFACNDNFGIVVYQLSTVTVYYSIIDMRDFSVVVDRRAVPIPFSPPVTPTCVQCARVGDDFVVGYAQDSDNEIYLYKVNGTTFIVDSVATATITNKRVNSKAFSIVNDRQSPSTGFWVIYHRFSGSGDFRAEFYNNSFSNTSSVNLTSTASAQEECYVDVYASNFYCVFSDPFSPSWRVLPYDNTGSPISVGETFAGETLTNAAISAYPGEVVVSAQVGDTTVDRLYDSSITAATVQKSTVNGAKLCSGPAKLSDSSGNSIFLHNLVTQGNSVTELSTRGIACYWIPKRVNGGTGGNPRLLGFFGMGSAGFEAATTIPKSGGHSSTSIVTLGLSAGTILVNRVRLITSGLTTKTGYIQNHNVTGDNFNLINFPGALTATTSDPVTAESYSYTGTLTYTDDTGRLVESLPAIPVVSTSAATIVFGFPLVGVNPTDFRLRAYRTLANQSSYHLAEVISFDSFYPLSPNLASVTWSLAISDDDLSVNPQLYTEGGALDHVCPPVFTCSTKHQNRLFLGGTPDDTIWFSNERIAGETYHFNEGLTFQPFEGGRVVALQSLDSALVVFKSEDIYAIQGQGPNDQGLDSSYSLPQNIQSNTGCTEADSVVSTPMGIFFRGRRGLYLLDRALQVKYIGKPIENDLTSSITDAVYVESQNQVRFFTSQGVFVYDLLNDAWSLFTYPVTFVKAAVSGGILYMVNTLGNLYKETTGYLDDGARYSMKFQTAYFRPQNGLKQAWQRFRRVSIRGHKDSDYGVIITLMRDGIDSQSESRSWTPSDITYRPNDPQLQVHPAVQKMQSLSVQFEDYEAGTTGTGKGWTLQSISCKVAAARGEAKVPSGNNK